MSIQVFKHKKHVQLWHSCDQGVKFFVELFLVFIGIGHYGAIGTDDGDAAFVSQKELKGHQLITNIFWDAWIVY